MFIKNIHYLFFMGLKYLAKCGKNIAETTGSFFLGFLPEQDYLERKISWYNADKGVLLSGVGELGFGFFGGIGGTFVDTDELTRGFLIGTALFELISGLCRVHDDLEYSSNREKNIKDKSKKDTRIGNIALEIPYRFVKNVVKKDVAEVR